LYDITSMSIDKYTQRARSHTRCKGISVHEYEKVKDKPYVQRYMAKYGDWPRCFQLYFGSCQPFRIEHATLIYERFQPRSVLDPTAGWGGRAIASSALGIPYFGFDCNPELIEPYDAICRDWAGITFLFGDCMQFNWPPADMVFTSPPYFNREVYTGSTKKSKQVWRSWYTQFATKCRPYKYICLNVTAEIYEILEKVLGQCSGKILLPIRKRRNYEEFVYCWW
jgi:hypothetical protein